MFTLKWFLHNHVYKATLFFSVLNEKKSNQGGRLRKNIKEETGFTFYWKC